jgi:hypothetical protein
MPKTEVIIKVFVSSPTDVNDERNLLEEVIRELNISWSKFLGLRLDLLRWETHVSPGIGTDPQDVINEGITDDYDIFIGIMWQRFGTPTTRYGSGTVEEFERAYERYKRNPDEVKIMFYFKDAPPNSISEIDAEQITAITKFKKSLGDKGTLYWTVQNREDFESLLRMHLVRQLQSFSSYIQSSKALSETEVSPIKERPTNIIDEEEGFLDILELFENSTTSMERATEILGQMTSDVVSFGDKISKHTQELQKIKRGPSSLKIFKEITDGSARDMNELSNSLEAKLDDLHIAHQESFRSFSKAIILSFDFAPASEVNELDKALETMKALKETMGNAQSVTESFTSTISSFPSLSKNFNGAKKRAVKTLESVTNTFGYIRNLADETEKTIIAIKNSSKRTK